MAQNKVLLTVFLALLAGCAVLIGCAGEGAGNSSERGGNNVNSSDKQEPSTFPGLDAETERRIIQDRFNKYGTSSSILRYLGTYNGCVVIQFPYSPMTVVWHEKIDDIWFHDASPPGITVWKDGVFYTMTALYEQGLLTREDLLTIFDIHEELKAIPAIHEKLKEGYFGKN